MILSTRQVSKNSTNKKRNVNKVNLLQKTRKMAHRKHISRWGFAISENGDPEIKGVAISNKIPEFRLRRG